MINIIESRVTSSRHNLKESTMIISHGSSINGDNVEITINNGEETIFNKKYHYGYSISYDKIWSNEDKPFIDDLVQELKTKYNVTDVKEEEGKNVFRDTVREGTLEPGIVPDASDDDHKSFGYKGFRVRWDKKEGEWVIYTRDGEREWETQSRKEAKDFIDSY